MKKNGWKSVNQLNKHLRDFEVLACVVDSSGAGENF